MYNRFTLKDFIFTVLLLAMLAAVLLAMWQFNWQEHRLNAVEDQLKIMNSFQKQQLAAIEDLRDSVRSGVSVKGSATEPATTQQAAGVIDRKTEDGGQYVFYPTAPRTPKPRSVKFSPLRTARPTPS